MFPSAIHYEGSVPTALECAICRTAFTEPTMLLPCAHVFCKTCLEASLGIAALCPLDRLPVQPQRDLKPAPRNLQDLLDDLTVTCEACGWQGRREAAQDHLCSSGNSEAESSTAAHRREQQQVACPQSTRGCSARLSPTDLEQHTATCPFVALSAYFDIQDHRSTLLHSQLTGLGDQVSALDERLTRQVEGLSSNISLVEANVEAAQVRNQLAVLDESMQIAHEFSGLRAGLEGVRRQLFGLLLERESRVAPARTPFMPPQPVVSPGGGGRTDTGTKL